MLTLSVGAGHNGLATAAQLKSMGIDALVVDTQKRVGDNWRLRYRYVSYTHSYVVTDVQISLASRSGLGQSPPFHPIPSYLAALHPRWKARQFPRIIRRDP
jgi:cation diffusion facilitator CzcD-associated flavoprotein CzcO